MSDDASNAKFTFVFSDQHLDQPVHLRLHEQRFQKSLSDSASDEEQGQQ